MENQQKSDLQNLSFNELQELGVMMGEITQTINAYYSHVKKYKETERRIF